MSEERLRLKAEDKAMDRNIRIYDKAMSIRQYVDKEARPLTEEEKAEIAIFARYALLFIKSLYGGELPRGEAAELFLWELDAPLRRQSRRLPLFPHPGTRSRPAHAEALRRKVREALLILQGEPLSGNSTERVKEELSRSRVRKRYANRILRNRHTGALR